MCNNSPPPTEHGAIYETIWENMQQADWVRYDSIIQRMRFACWISKAPDTHSEYVILISFVQQQ